jgi:hypothetical protein
MEETIKIGNGSFNIEACAAMTREEFVSAHKGKLNVDAGEVYDKIKEAQNSIYTGLKNRLTELRKTVYDLTAEGKEGSEEYKLAKADFDSVNKKMSAIEKSVPVFFCEKPYPKLKENGSNQSTSKKGSKTKGKGPDAGNPETPRSESEDNSAQHSGPVIPTGD